MSNSSSPTVTQCLYVFKDTNDVVQREFRELPLSELPNGSVRIKVRYSSLNYKDALCATGHPGVARKLPIVPGIDASGTVVASRCPEYSEGDSVMVFHADFGTSENGGLSEYIDVPANWVYQIPKNLDEKSCMILGTAGFTAAQCVDELIRHDIRPESGEIVVTGATGGVGICSVRLLSQLGYHALAVTGKSDKVEWLKELGASEVVGREAVNDESPKPLLRGRWAGAVDSVGGNTLATILRSTMPRGCVTACGLVGGVDFSISVYPFILRGVTLQGIDTAGIAREYRQRIWDRLANEWAIEKLEQLAVETSRHQIESRIDEILAGQICGRVLVGF
ncbi:MAG: YhdH/YhfP family quinone oxidoreductase [Planctomycetota bacterium]